MRRRIRGPRAIAAALDAGEEIARILMLEGASSPELRSVAERAAAAGVPVDRESAREMTRMSESPAPEEILAWLGPPLARELAALMAAPGLVLLLAGVRYPANAGFVLRTAEVAGAAGVVIDAQWGPAARAEASRVSIRAARFLPVLHASAYETVAAARAAGRRIIAVETTGGSSPWDTDLRSPALVVLGSETQGIPQAILREADATLRIPTRGFIPSYNVQAATGMLIGEWLRQTVEATPDTDSGAVREG